MRGTRIYSLSVMAVRGFFFEFFFENNFFLKKFPEKTTPLMEVLRPVLDSSRDGLFGGMKQKKNRGREYFCPDRFLVNIIFENVPDVKMGKTQRI